MPSIEFKNVSVSYFKKKIEKVVLKNINHLFENEKTHVIVGFSGCGKTTLLKTLFDSVDYDGEILLNERDILKISVQDRNIGYVSQNYGLYPHMSVFNIIAFPLKVMGAPMEEIKKRVREIAKELEIEVCLTRRPKEISGGQQQRVALARALVKNPSICLLDEPFSNLDHESSVKARELVKNVLKKRKITVLYVSHDINEATSLADRIHFLHEGDFIFEGTSKEFLSSKNPTIKEFINSL